MANPKLRVKPCHNRPERLHIQSNLHQIFISKKNRGETSKLQTRLDELSKREFISRKTHDYDIFTTNRFLKNVRYSSGHLRKSNYQAKSSLSELQKDETKFDTSPLNTGRSGMSFSAPVWSKSPMLSTDQRWSSELEASLPPAHLLNNHCSPMLRYKCIRRLARSLTPSSVFSDSRLDSMTLRAPNRIIIEYCDHTELDKEASPSASGDPSLGRKESSVIGHVGRILSASGRRRVSAASSVYTSD